MSEEMIVRHCSPTLAGLKTANMFVCTFASKDTMQERMRYWNKVFSKKGLRVLPLKFHNCRALVYIYRPKRLLYDLQNKEAMGLLTKRGYIVQTPEKCILQLIKKLKKNSEFPHEIGLFLGYPPEDVIGFIENSAKNFKCSGLWKVYGDEKRAKYIFAKYKKCTSIYIRYLAKGNSVEFLTVADKNN